MGDLIEALKILNGFEGTNTGQFFPKAKILASLEDIKTNCLTADSAIFK